MRIELNALPYPMDALEPFISAGTLHKHHRNHYQACVEKLGSLIPGTSFENANLKTMIKEANGPIFYNATQIWNHSFYFTGIAPKKEYNLNGLFADAIRFGFGSLKGFREAFTKSAASITGTGWIWLLIDDYGELEIVYENDCESPLSIGMMPVLGIDLCEHAYYADYKNRRIDYINSFWNLINWEIIEKRYCYAYAKNGFKKTT
jgi:superoxide dismutase, Fe-Mn family